MAKPAIVLVHGAYADGSSWRRVVPLLLAAGHEVVVVQNPLLSLEDDVAATKRAMALVEGDVVLVGHSWGGAVISEAGTHERVTALVYVAAGAPDPGQSFSEMAKDFPTEGGKHRQPDEQGFVRLSREGIQDFFAADLPREETAVMAVSQVPIHAARCFGQKLAQAAWRDKPSFYVLARDDQMIAPALQAQLAEKIGAEVLEVEASHVPMLSQPEAVARLILRAAGG